LRVGAADARSQPDDHTARVAEPIVNEKAGPLSNIYGVVHQQVWSAQILQTGDYTIAIDGNVNGFLRPQLAFGSTE
jgi:hypothetical protein